MNRNELIRALPKAELHVHIEGTFEPELMFAIAQRNQIDIPYKSVEEVKQVCHFVAEKKGGCGAVRQITEFILNARGDWDKIVNSYLQEGQGDAQ